jgi:NitT/TauT family transport system substrate-binding protein
VITAASLRGKNIDVWNGSSPNVSALLSKLHLSTSQVHIYTQGANMQPLLSGQVDVAMGETYNEYAQTLAGAHGKKINVFDFASVGLSELEDSINAMPSWLATHRSETVAFIRASAKGWIYCRDNPAACVRIVERQGVALEQNFQVWQMAEINKLIWPSTVGIYNLTPSMVAQTAGILLKYGVIKHPVPASAVNMSYRNAAVGGLDSTDVHDLTFTGQQLNPLRLFG